MYYRINKVQIVFAIAVVSILSSCSAIKRTVAPIVQRNNIPDAPSNPVVINNIPAKPVLRHRPPYMMVPPEDSIARKYAAILGVKKSDIHNGRLYDFINQWMGAPYLFGGLARDGVDCSGLVYLLQQQVYDIGEIPRTTTLQVDYINPKNENELKEGDLVFFDFDNKPHSHVGVYLMNGYIVHASTTKGVVIVKLALPSIHKYYSKGGHVIDPADLPQAGDGN